MLFLCIISNERDMANYTFRHELLSWFAAFLSDAECSAHDNRQCKFMRCSFVRLLIQVFVLIHVLSPPCLAIGCSPIVFWFISPVLCFLLLICTSIYFHMSHICCRVSVSLNSLCQALLPVSSFTIALARLMFVLVSSLPVYVHLLIAQPYGLLICLTFWIVFYQL